MVITTEPATRGARSERARRAEPWALMAWLLPAAAVLLSLMPVNDLAYQIRAGQVMLDTHRILRDDVFTYTIAGQRWIDQQWSAQLVFAGLFRVLGWRGLVMLRALLASVAVGTTYQRTRSAGGDPLVAGCLCIGAFAATIFLPGTVALRPQLLAIPLFILSAWILQTRGSHPRRLAALPLIAVAWANTHGSFVLLPLLIAIAFIGDAVSRRRTAKWTALLTVVTVLTPLVTPWGTDTYRYVRSLTASPVVRDVVDEWRPIMHQSPAGIIFVGACLLILVTILRRRTRDPSAEELVGLIAFTALVFWSGRNILWWALYVPPIVGAITAGWRPGSPASPRAATGIAVALVALVLLGTGRVLVTRPVNGLLNEAPPGITEAVREQTQGGARVFAGWWGSWFELTLPDVPMFVDARAEVFPDAVWRDYFLATDAGPGWQRVFDRWGVDVVAVSRRTRPKLIPAMEADPGWSVVYEDADGVVFARSSP